MWAVGEGAATVRMRLGLELQGEAFFEFSYFIREIPKEGEIPRVSHQFWPRLFTVGARQFEPAFLQKGLYSSRSRR